MKQNIDWKSITEPLDVTNVYAPKHYIRAWTAFKRTETGVIFHCNMANGEELDYDVDVIDVDIFRMRMNPQGIIECGSDMLIKCEFPPVPFSVVQQDDRLVIVTSRMRVEFPRAWQVTAYDQPEPGKGHIFYQESTEDRAYVPGFEVPPTGFEVSETGDYFVRQSVAIQPGESFYGLGEKFTSLDKWKHEIPLWAVDSGNVSTSRSYKNVPLEILTLWVKAGSIIPMGPEMDYVNQKPMDPLTIEIYLPAGSEKILIEDEDCQPVEVSYTRNGNQLVVDVSAAPGAVEIVLMGERVQSARIAHNALDVAQGAFGSRVQLDGRSGVSLVLDLES